MQQSEVEMYVDKSFYDFVSAKLNVSPEVAGFFEDSEIPCADIAFSIGGDGTFLRTAARIGKTGIPILGINTGRLGFLADISGNEVKNVLPEIIAGNYQIESRTLLRLSTDKKSFSGFNYALNEVAVLKLDVSSMITIHAYINNNYLNSYQADGLIIATPTGSTAYSMSVGGPIIEPTSSNIVLTPVAPHSLNVRPLVITDDSVVTLKVESRTRNVMISLDGRSEVFDSDTEIIIRKADFATKVVKRFNHTFFDTIRNKLMWGADSR
jgi:NAD+ kinase